MSKFNFYSESGLFSSFSISCPDEFIERNTPEGFTAFSGNVDPKRQRLDIETGELVEYTPPKPDDTKLTAFEWDAEAWEWVGVPTLLARQNTARADRDARLTACDWTQGRDIPDAVASMWAPYRQALRDVPEQPGFPDAIEWPTPPQ